MQGKTIPELLDQIVGTYQIQIDNSGNIITGIAGLDYRYIFSCLILLLFIFCIFKLMGGIICNK